MAGKWHVEKLAFTNSNLLCSAEKRPEPCHQKTNLCCLYCNLIIKCMETNKSKVKPCTTDIIGADEFCDLSI